MNTTTSPPRTLLLIDGSSYLYRAFHAMPDLRAVPGDPSSAPTGAIRGFINMIQSLKKEQLADLVACVFDAPGGTFRDDLYADYKANRSPMPEDLRSQIAPIHEVVQAMGLTMLCVGGVEADDVIGTLAAQAAAQGLQVVVSSGDKDLSQLVNEHITIIDTMNGKRRDVAGVTAEFGVPPSQMLDYQCLVGDSVDNVPGVEKVGPKTAVKWLQEYGSLEGIVSHADQIKGVVGDKLRQALDWLPKGRALLSIKTDCDLSAHIPVTANGQVVLEALRWKEPDAVNLRAFYERHGFKGLVKAMSSEDQNTATGSRNAQPKKQDEQEVAPVDDLFWGSGAVNARQDIQTHYDIVMSWEAFDRWMLKIEAADLVALDTETTCLSEMQARIVGISVSVAVGEAAYIPLAHNYPGAPAQLPLDDVLQRLKPWLENPAKLKLGQHIKYDRHVLANHDINVRGYAHDTMLQSYVLEAHRPHGLASLAERHVGRKGIAYEDLCGKGVNQIGFDQVDIERAGAYSCEDSDMTLDVHLALWPKLQANPALLGIYQLEIESSESLFRIERNGVHIDALALQQQSKELGERILELETQAQALAGQPFNLSSPKQIGEILFTQQGLPVVKKTASGAPSTDEEVLEKLAEDYPLPAKILEHRGLQKLKSTYTDKLGVLANPRTGRVHTHYAQAVAVTGRLSSNDPNLQNIPIRTPEGRRVREAFVAASGHCIASADYSQIELRIMAHISQDPALLKAFHEGIDVHRATAAEVFGLEPAAVSSEQRRYAKVINFGLIYGMSAFGLARSLGIDNVSAKNYIARYFERFAGVKRYMDETRQSAKRLGYVETVLGRRLYLPEINSPNGPRRAGAERAAINAPMQGTAADLIKLSMNAVQNELDAKGLKTKLIMQVHDELVFELPDVERDWVRSEVPRLMASVANLRVPLLAEVGFGANWDAAH
jgi:DNA polymerase I